MIAATDGTTPASGPDADARNGFGSLRASAPCTARRAGGRCARLTVYLTAMCLNQGIQ